MTDFTPFVQLWFNTILIWIGFGTVAGLMAQALLPKGKPNGLYGILVIGICGSCIGIFIIDTTSKYIKIDEFSNINPISPLGLFAAIIVSLMILLIYRLTLIIVSLCTKESTNNSQHKTQSINQSQSSLPAQQPAAAQTSITPPKV
ncbi:MAG: GlsB/YeaQ/YmgE family stress response membrane protein [Planctomycetaceae bacterium]|jgi:uncharacterized membrane protein YeaQ/YmgE (transglycosylase-associated protein family)|nr:GlsB/YeaQ/YmgE family stress response membrane protein [Planctomycetaceae bacterium]